MPRTVESIVENYRVARARQAAGQPVWDHRLDVRAILSYDADNLSAECIVAKAHAVAALLRAGTPGSWLDITSDDYDRDLDEIVDEFEGLTVTSCQDDPEYTLENCFNGWMDTLYDWADSRRVWLSSGLKSDVYPPSAEPSGPQPG